MTVINDNTVKIFNSSDLPGAFLTRPLKNFHGYFVQKKSLTTGNSKLVAQIMHIAIGIFAYPLLVSLAAVGMLIKWTGIKKLEKFNESQKLYFEGGIIYRMEELANEVPVIPGELRRDFPGFFCRSTISISIPVQERIPTNVKKFKEYSEDKRPIKVVFNEINDAIDLCTQEYKKVYLDAYYRTRGDGIDFSCYIDATLKVTE